MARTARGRAPARSRKFVWARRTLNNQPTPADQPFWLNILDQFETEYGAQLLGATVMRIRGKIMFITPEVTNVNFAMAAGIIVDSDENIADGVDDGPWHAPHKDWMAYEPVIFSGQDPTFQNYVWDIDVKSNRKIEELGQGLALVFDNRSTGETGSIVDMAGVVSVGLKLP